MQDLSPDSNPFETAYRALPFNAPTYVRDSLIQVNDTVHMAKCILLQNKVRSFTAADVVEVTKLILEREAVLCAREQAND